jgi:hypothetical protein
MLLFVFVQSIARGNEALEQDMHPVPTWSAKTGFKEIIERKRKEESEKEMEGRCGGLSSSQYSLLFSCFIYSSATFPHFI